MLLWPKNHWQHYYVLEVSKGGGSTTRTAGPYRPHQVMLSNESWVEGGGRGGRHSGLWHSSSQAATSHPETLLSRNSWTFICLWEVVHEYLFLLCLSTRLLFSLLSCPGLNPQVFSHSFFFLFIPQERGVSKMLRSDSAVGWGQPATGALPLELFKDIS